MMKRMISQWITATVVTFLSTSVALAAGGVKITLDCPDIEKSGLSKVTHYGTYIAGNGSEKINGGSTILRLLQGPVSPGQDIPVDLKTAGYRNDGVTYNPSNGYVICKYKSAKSHDSFALSYQLENALGGTVPDSTKSHINIKIPVGLK